jgi:hypothetical protein
MTHHDDHLRDAELGPVIDRLRAERPTASALELDSIAQRVHSRVARDARRSRRTEFMRSRLAIVGMLVFGMVLSTSGAGLAISGFADSESAAISQYGGGVAPEQDVNDFDEGEGGIQGREDEGGGDDAVQPTRQAEAGVQSSGDDGDQLPFTGFAAIPVLLGGIALLSAGLVLRRRTDRDE